MIFAAEAAADVVRLAAKLLFRPAEQLTQQPLKAERILDRTGQRHLAGPGIAPDHDAPGFHRVRNQAIVDEIERHDVRRACKRLFGFLGISDPPEKTEIAGAVVGPYPGRLRLQRLPRVHDTIEDRVLNVDALQRVERLTCRFRHDHADAFADVPDPAYGQSLAWGGGDRRTIGLLDRRTQRQSGEACALPIRAGIDRNNPRRGSRD